MPDQNQAAWALYWWASRCFIKLLYTSLMLWRRRKADWMLTELEEQQIVKWHDPVTAAKAIYNLWVDPYIAVELSFTEIVGICETASTATVCMWDFPNCCWLGQVTKTSSCICCIWQSCTASASSPRGQAKVYSEWLYSLLRHCHNGAEWRPLWFKCHLIIMMILVKVHDKEIQCCLFIICHEKLS